MTFRQPPDEARESETSNELSDEALLTPPSYRSRVAKSEVAIHDSPAAAGRRLGAALGRK